MGVSIGEIARRVGVEASTIRYYEGIGLLPPAARVNGRRTYGADTLKRLALIRATKEVGFTIREIHTLIAAWETQGRLPKEWLQFARSKIAEMDAAIARARGVKRILSSVLACKCWDGITVPLDSFVDSLVITSPLHGKGLPSMQIARRRS